MIENAVNNIRLQKAAYRALILIIFFFYWLFSSQYTGPAYLSDEIGYLTKAAAFAGFPLDMASSWHGGYSLILSPLFMIFSDPFVLWQGIMVLNAALWAFSFMLLFTLLKAFFPDHNFWAIFFSVVISAAYPAWITMSGYTFATTGFVFVFMLSIFTLLKISVDNIWTIVPYSLLIGFLYWIHPTGLAVAVASVISVASVAWYCRQYKILIFHLIIIGGVMVTYKLGVHHWLSQFMTPENNPIWNHYGSMSSVMNKFLSLKSWTAWLVIFFGQLSYLLISTLGICFYAVMETWNRIVLARVSDETNPSILVNASLVFMVLSILGIVALGSLFFSPGSSRLDLWIYGRYSEMVLLPLFGVGLLALWRLKYAVAASLIVLAASLMISLYGYEFNTLGYINLVNIQSFWPQAFFTHENFTFWFIAGVAGIILTSLLKKKLFAFLAIPLFVISIYNQNDWHNSILDEHSKPSKLIELITSNFQYGQCIGFDASRLQNYTSSQKERRNLYSYYLFNYDIRRMTPEEWLLNCDGPYLTYESDVFSDTPEVKIIAREVSTGLFIAVKREILDNISIKSLRLVNSDLSVDLRGNNSCLINGCFTMNAFGLMKFSQVGDFGNRSITSTGAAGYLFYGPYYQLKKGKYYIKLDGRFDDLDGAVLDIVSGQGNNKYLDIKLSDHFNSVEDSIAVPFSIDSDANEIEIRLHVSSSTKLIIYGYSIALGQSIPETRKMNEANNPNTLLQ